MMIKYLKSSNANKKTRKNTTYTKNDYNSGDGMLTSVWGPGLWHYLHTMSFNYPVEPTSKDKKQYKNFILSLKNVLPCKYCRENLKKNLKVLPLTKKVLESRENFSRYIYDLHEHINKMLGKTSGLSFEDVRDRYEHFRSRCTLDLNKKELNKLLKLKHKNNKTRKIEKGCTTPLYGKKSKCVIKIVPQDTTESSFQMDDRCIKMKV